MNTKRHGFAPVPDAIARMAEAAPGGSQHVPSANTQAEANKPHEAPENASAVLSSTGFRLPVREPSQSMHLKVPKSLYDDLRNFMKLTDISMTEVMVEGARKELAALRRKHGLE
jgi:hypothetical protein